MKHNKFLQMLVSGALALALMSGCAAPVIGGQTEMETAPADPARPTASPAAVGGKQPGGIAPALEGTPGGAEDRSAITLTEPAGTLTLATQLADKVTPQPSGGEGAPRVAFETTPSGVDKFAGEAFITLCLFAGTGATMGFDGQRLNFTCAQAGEVSIGLFGDVQADDEGWVLLRKSFKPGADEFIQLGSETVRVETVLLHDGPTCLGYTGGGRYNKKQAYYACAGSGDTQLVLLGTPAPGDEGWMIEVGKLECGGGACRLTDVEMALIDGLGVRK